MTMGVCGGRGRQVVGVRGQEKMGIATSDDDDDHNVGDAKIK